LPRKPEEPWFERVAARMVQEGKSFEQAVTEENVYMKSDEAQRHFKRASFQRCLRQARHRFHKEIAQDPERTKSTLIGQLQVCADKLMVEGNFDKAAEVLLKISKIEGWVGPDQNIQVFGLNQSQIDAAREALKQKLDQSRSESSSTAGTDSPLLN
jgi:hypothetical protein